MGTLSVRENLQFSAALRLPAHMTAQQRKDRVERVLDTLNLQKCANTKVTGENLSQCIAERKFFNPVFHLVQFKCLLF